MTVSLYKLFVPLSTVTGSDVGSIQCRILAVCGRATAKKNTSALSCFPVVYLFSFTVYRCLNCVLFYIYTSRCGPKWWSAVAFSFRFFFQNTLQANQILIWKSETFCLWMCLGQSCMTLNILTPVIIKTGYAVSSLPVILYVCVKTNRCFISKHLIHPSCLLSKLCKYWKLTWVGKKIYGGEVGVTVIDVCRGHGIFSPAKIIWWSV